MTINLQAARRLLKLAVETQGRDFRYSNGGTESCYYVPLMTEVRGWVELRKDARAKTPCLVGVVLRMAGETRQTLLENHETTVFGLAERYPDMMTPLAAAYLQVAQEVQDKGGTWGDAYDEAELGSLDETLGP